MSPERFDSASPSSLALFARFGEPEEVFRPSSGQTFGGIMVGCIIAFIGLAVALFVAGVELLNRVYGAGFGIAGLGLAYWFYKLRQWRLMICPDGLVQVRSGGIDEIAWSEVHEVVETRSKGAETPYKVTIMGRASKMAVRPINLRSWKKLFKVLLDAARQRGIPIRIEWVETSDNS